MPLLWRWFRDFKDRIVYGIVFLMGCALLVFGFSGGGLEFHYYGTGTIILSWIAWGKEGDYLHWLRRRAEAKGHRDAAPRNEIPSDPSLAREFTDRDNGPHFTYDLDKPFWRSDSAPAAKSTWFQGIILSLLGEPALLIGLCLIILIALGYGVSHFLIYLIFFVAKYPIAVFAIVFVIPFTMYLRDRLYLKKCRSAQMRG